MSEKNILEIIAERTRERIKDEKRSCPLKELEAQARVLAAAEKGFNFPFEQALRTPNMSFICEVKKASPSKGVIAQDFDPVAIARSYADAGAAAISVLTEPYFFQGKNDYLKKIVQAVSLPVLRKDFVVDEYMIYEAKVLGAQAVLLICSLLDDEELSRFIRLAHELGLSALVEAYEPSEVPRAIAAGARIVGVNNRDLRTFKVDFGRSIKLAPEVGHERIFVSESGVKTRDDIKALETAGVGAVLIGETLMRAHDKRAALSELRGSSRTRVKLCGISREKDVQAINKAHPDFAGFIINYPRSHRSITPERAAILTAQLAPDILSVGVFVDEEPKLIAELFKSGVIALAQLHGNEDEAYIAALKALVPEIKLIQAFTVASEADVARAKASSADLVLLDNGKGTGNSFDWSLVKRISRPFMLAGGLTPENVGKAIEELTPWGVDMSSGIETDKLKDANKIAAAVAAVRSA